MVTATAMDSVTIASQSGLHISGRFGSHSFDAAIDNRDVLDALERFDHPARAVEVLLTIGACATLASSNGFSAQALRSELDGAVERTTAAMGELREHVVATVGAEGPLARAVAQVADDLVASLRETVANQSDPDTPGTLVAKIKGSIAGIDAALAAARASIAKDFQETSERQSDSIKGALREMRDLDPSSALGRALTGIESTVAELSRTVAAAQATAGERNRGTLKGADYEEFTAIEVAAVASVHGDAAERTGNRPGQLILNKKPSLRGDVTVRVSGGQTIVVEAMDRAASVLTFRLVSEELVEAMENRAARAAIAVISGAENPIMCGQRLQFLGDDKWAVVLQKDEPDALALQVAYKLARARVLSTPNREQEIDVEVLRGAVEDINQKLTGLGEVKSQLSNISRCGDKAQAAVVKVEREVRNAVIEIIDSLAGDRGERDDAA